MDSEFGVTGRQGEFWVVLPDGDYRVSLGMGDRKGAWGPFDIYLRPASQVRRNAGGGPNAKLVFPVKVSGGKLRLRFEAGRKQSFQVNELVIEGARGTKLRRLFDDAPLDYLPSRTSCSGAARRMPGGATKLLRVAAAHPPAERVPGDWGSYGTSREPRYYWYTAPYPIRTLLAGYAISANSAIARRQRASWTTWWRSSCPTELSSRCSATSPPQR